MANWKKVWATKEERDEHNRRVDDDIARLRRLAEKAQADLDAKKQAEERAAQG
jgi:hypothetical protein